MHHPFPLYSKSDCNLKIQSQINSGISFNFLIVKVKCLNLRFIHIWFHCILFSNLVHIYFFSTFNQSKSFKFVHVLINYVSIANGWKFSVNSFNAWTDSSANKRISCFVEKKWLKIRLNQRSYQLVSIRWNYFDMKQIRFWSEQCEIIHINNKKNGFDLNVSVALNVIDLQRCNR